MADRPNPVLILSLCMANTKPFVAVASLAEVVIIEPDDVASIIRIADTFHVHIPPNLPAEAKPAIVLNAFVSLKSGDVKGTFDVGLLLRPPSGKEHLFGTWPVVLEGGIHGANIRMKLDLRGLELEKIYWIDVLWGEQKEVLTSIPFRFKRAEATKDGPVEPNTQEKQSGV